MITSADIVTTSKLNQRWRHRGPLCHRGLGRTIVGCWILWNCWSLGPWLYSCIHSYSLPLLMWYYLYVINILIVFPPSCLSTWKLVFVSRFVSLCVCTCMYLNYQLLMLNACMKVCVCVCLSSFVHTCIREDTERGIEGKINIKAYLWFCMNHIKGSLPFKEQYHSTLLLFSDFSACEPHFTLSACSPLYIYIHHTFVLFFRQSFCSGS